MNIRDRIKELRRVRAGDLRPHPKNWRKHPQKQHDALRGILADVGYVDALMVRELSDGALQIVDGHLRAETTSDAPVPVLVVDLDDKEADKVLATFDPLGAMAEPDELVLEQLLKGIETDSEARAAMLEQLSDDAGCGNGGEITEDDVPERPDVAITQPGDLWILGDHRLLCGDSSKPEDVDRSLNAQSIQLVNSDPPYNVKVEPRSNNAIAAGLSSFSSTHHQGLDLARHPGKAKPTQRKLRPRTGRLRTTRPTPFLAEALGCRRVLVADGGRRVVLVPCETFLTTVPGVTAEGDFDRAHHGSTNSRNHRQQNSGKCPPRSLAAYLPNAVNCDLPFVCILRIVCAGHRLVSAVLILDCHRCI